MTLEGRVLDVVGDVLGLLDLDELSKGMLEALQRAIPSDFAALNEVPADLPRSISITNPAVCREVHETFARLALQNPIAAHFIQTPDGRATRFSDLISHDELHRLEIYDALYRPLGIEHQIACTLPAPTERILGVVLSRSRRDCSDRERDLLNLMRPYLIQAYRNALAYSLPRVGQQHAIDSSKLESRGLTARQVEVLQLIATGHSNQDAAAQLGISVRTVEKHLERTYRVLGVENRSQAAQLTWKASGGSARQAAAPGRQRRHSALAPPRQPATG